MQEDATDNKQHALVRYDDDVQEDNIEDNIEDNNATVSKESLLSRMGKTFSRSLARSRSTSRYIDRCRDFTSTQVK